MKFNTEHGQKLNFRQWGILFTVLVMYFFAPEFGAISPILMLLPDYYGITAAQVSWISAFANPTACMAGLCIGFFAGKRVSYRTCAVLATGLYFIFGGLPYLWHDIPFWMLLVSRAMFGFGCGCLVPISQAVITHMFKDETIRSVWIGIINIIFSIGASIGSVIVGALANDGTWQNGFSFYIFAAIPFILCAIFFQDKDILGKRDETEEQVEQKEHKARRSLSGVAVAFIVTYTFSTLLTQTFFNYTGMAMAEYGADPLLIGIVFMVFTVAGIVIAAVYPAFWKVLRLWNYPLAFVCIAMGYVFCIIAYLQGSTPLFFAAAITMGLGCCIAGMVMPMVMSVTVSAASLTLAIGLQEVARNLGSFMSASWLNAIATIFGDTSMIQFIAAAVLGVVMSCIAIFIAARNNKRFLNVDMSVDSEIFDPNAECS